MSYKNLIKVILIVFPATLLLTGCSLNVMQGGVSGGLFVVLLSLLGAGCRQGLEGESQMATFLRYMAASYGVNTKSSSNPEIEVRIGGAHVKSGEGVYDLGSAKRNELDYTKTVLIQNTGNDYLVIDRVEITGENGDQFHAEYEDKAIPPGENDSFELLYTPSKDVSSHTAQVIIHNNDEDESNFTIPVSASTILSCALTRDWTQPIDLSQDRTTTGDGFRVLGANPGDIMGSDLAMGDVNLDGIDDIITGASGASTDVTYGQTGEVYILYGKNTGFTDFTPFSEDLIGMEIGFKIQHLNPMDDEYYLGAAILNAGDVNGDGLDDYLILQLKSSTSSLVYLLFGKTEVPPVNPDIGSSLSEYGVALDTSPYDIELKIQITKAGDMNGDGFDDIAISTNSASYYGLTNSGSVWVIYGKPDSKWNNFALSSIVTNPDLGFRIDGASSEDNAGKVISGAGDFNGDGLGDLIIGAPGADNSGSNQGAAYIIFGRKDKPSILKLGNLRDGDGMKIYSDGSDAIYWGEMLKNIGDVNQDGYDDVILGNDVTDSLVILHGGNSQENRSIYNDGIFYTDSRPSRWIFPYPYTHRSM